MEIVEVACSPQPKPEWIEHPISGVDTLVGLSLKYNTTVAAIRKMNNLGLGEASRPVQSLTFAKILKIPTTGVVKPADPKQLEGLERRKMISAFQREMNCDEGEAKTYLEMENYIFDQAVAAMKRDVIWESQNKPIADDKKSQRDVTDISDDEVVLISEMKQENKMRQRK